MSAETSFTGPDGLPFGPDEPAVTAERASKLADELAALAEQLIRVMGWQQQALTLASGEVSEQVQAGQLDDAKRINTRAQASLRLLRDCLGEQHVECDELAHQLTILLDDRAAGTSGGRRARTGVAG